jgi:magnesium-protoporphyrin O-methyltransferase
MVMACCGQCTGFEKEFNAKVAAKELATYRRRGATWHEEGLDESPPGRGRERATLLDIGGGIGAIQHDLVREGVVRVTSVDASSAYVDVQTAEAARLGYADRATHLHGDFVALASEVGPCDIVTLDRVICCYPSMRSLVELSVARANRLYGLVYPRKTRWNAIGIHLVNVLMAVRRSSFRSYLHPPAEVDTLIRSAGFRLRAARQTFLWHVKVHARSTREELESHSCIS